MWKLYSEWLWYYLVLFSIKDHRRSDPYANCCGPSTYQLLKSLLHLASPGDKTCNELIQILSDYFSPWPTPPTITRINKSCKSVAELITVDFGTNKRKWLFAN